MGFNGNETQFYGLWFFCEHRSDNGDGDSGERAMVTIGTTKVTTAALDFHGSGLSRWF
ncbi:hypothetical protein A2U01_0089154, partial [Trifolium medium]|nr:hypothetical protein [Trifolium medium]